jgi:phosphoribosylanthranilate isomerase
MNKATVKICGLQSIGTIKSIVNLPIDHIGFIFAKSKRQVTPKQAGEMIRFVTTKAESPPLSVGVFVNPTKQELEDVLKVAKLDVIQLHGTESPEFCQWVKDHLQVKVFKVFFVSSKLQDVETILMPYAAVIDALLLDTYDPVVGGGTGKTFAWDCIPTYQQWTKKLNIPLLIAGGLDASNVTGLLETYEPDGVDVSSGVEINGIKDINKVMDFVERVKSI